MSDNAASPSTPLISTKDAPEDPMDRLIWMMAALRSPDGCPWDREQTPATIAPYTIEEAYEVADAILTLDPERPESVAAYRDELGDLLLQVVYYAQMADEAGQFNFRDIAAGITDKMIRRHPHVFATHDADNPDAVHQMWEDIKAEERAQKAAGKPRSGPQSVLDDVPVTLPGLTRAVKLQKRAARVGFDWATLAPILDKLTEETDELREVFETDPSNQDRLEDEVGDMLFVLANIARRLEVDPEQALRRTNAKFERRFRIIETQFAARGETLNGAPLEAMEAEWLAAKAQERSEAAE